MKRPSYANGCDKAAIGVYRKPGSADSPLRGTKVKGKRSAVAAG